MRILQVNHAVTPDDAASNQMVAMDAAFRKLGYDSEIYSNKIAPSFPYRVKEYSTLVHDADSLLIYHFSTGTRFTDKILQQPHPVAVYYHNITPARYYFGNAWGSFFHCLKGRRQLAELGRKAIFGWAASEYSRQELKRNGFERTAVCPILMELEKYQIPVNEALYNKYKDGSLNILFVGRLVPHKCQHDLIEVVNQYQKKFGGGVRLFLVGGDKRSYRVKLEKLIRKYGLGNKVIITGKVSFPDLCTYYRVSDLFLSMSEHEGFGVPLIESMIFNKPVFAYSGTAVPETVGRAGLLFDSKNYERIATMIAEREEDGVLAHERHMQVTTFCGEAVLRNLGADIDLIKDYLRRSKTAVEAGQPA